MHYIAFIHTDDQPGFGISFPDFPGCISQGDTLDEALQLGQEALAFHVEGMEEDGTILPTPRSAADVWADKDLIDWREGAQLVWVPLVIDRGTPKRVNISLDQGLLAAVDATAKKRGQNRSAFLSSAARKEIAGGW